MSRPADSSDLDRLGGDLRQEMSAMGTDLRQKMSAMGTDLRQEIRATAEQVRGELRQEIRASAEQVQSELRQEIQASATAILDRVDASAAETRRHFDVVGEGLRSDIKAVAEGLGALDEKVERFRGEVREDFGRVDRRLLHLEVRVIGRSDPA